MTPEMNAKFKEGFLLFSGCEDSMEINQFIDLMNSFGIVMPRKDMSDIPDKITLDYWLDFANERFNFENPYEAITNASKSSADAKIRFEQFTGIMKALDSRLTDADYQLLCKITNPNKESVIDLKTVSDRLAAAI